MAVTGILQPDPVLSLLAAAWVLLVPGWALLSLLPVRQRAAGLLASLSDAAAFSVCISALAGLWLFVFHLRLNAWAVAGLFAACLLVGLVQTLRRGWARPALGEIFWGLLSLLALLAMIGWRLYQARDLALPAWVDSVHHVLITRVIFEYGGVPPTLEPYLPVPFFYHYGFHLTAALFAFWTGLSPEQSVLWLGQVVNAFVALSVYRAGSAFFGGEPATGPLRWVSRSMLAALLVGFAFQMPAYYLSWGRYTLLTGLLVLGPAMNAAVEVQRSPNDRAAAARLALLAAGLCVVHYLALLLLGLFVLVLIAGRGWDAVRRRSPRDLPWQLAAAGAAGLLLAAPWLWRVLSYNLASASVGITLPEGDGLQSDSLREAFSYLIYLLGPRHSHILLLLAGAGLLAALRRPGLRPLAAWTVLLLLLDLPWGLRLGPFRPDHYAIVLFFPAALFLAHLLVTPAERVANLHLFGRPLHSAAAGALLLVSGGLLAWGVRDTRDVVNSTTNFVTTSDVAALEWVKANTPPDARFYINSVLWQGQAYRGVDGGYWLLPYAGRHSMIPPIWYMLGDPQETGPLNDWARRSVGLNGCQPELWQMLRALNLTHLYLREGTGGLQPAELADCPRLRPVYRRGGVVIYEVPGP